MTLDGTNTYVVATGGAAYVIDPGPADERHLAAVREAAARRGGLAGLLLTHSHFDHSESVPMFDGTPLLWGVAGDQDETSAHSGAAEVPGGWPPEPRAKAGPFDVLATPGHAVDHVCFLREGVCFCGDLVLGRGSSFVPPDGGSLASYLESLRALQAIRPQLLCPGHGPYVTDPTAKLGEYLRHRLERERKLIAALDEGERSRATLLDRAWDDVPPELRPAAAVVMEAHLEKLGAEGLLDEVELVE